MFYEFNLFPCRNITLLTIPIKERHCRKNEERWKRAFLDMLFVFVEWFMFFGLGHSYVAKFLVFLFCLCLSYLSSFFAIYPKTIDHKCFPMIKKIIRYKN